MLTLWLCGALSAVEKMVDMNGDCERVPFPVGYSSIGGTDDGALVSGEDNCPTKVGADDFVGTGTYVGLAGPNEDDDSWFAAVVGTPTIVGSGGSTS